MRLTKRIGAVALSGAMAFGLATVTAATAPAASAKPACEGHTALASTAAPLITSLPPMARPSPSRTSGTSSSLST